MDVSELCCSLYWLQFPPTLNGKYWICDDDECSKRTTSKSKSFNFTHENSDEIESMRKLRNEKSDIFFNKSQQFPLLNSALCWWWSLSDHWNLLWEGRKDSFCIEKKNFETQFPSRHLSSKGKEIVFDAD